MFQKSNSALKGFPPFNFFIVFCVPWSILGVLALLSQMGYIGMSTFDALGIMFNIIFYFLSPLWVFSMAIFLSPGKYQCIGNVMKWLTCDWWVYSLILIGQGIFYLAMTYVFE